MWLIVFLVCNNWAKAYDGIYGEGAYSVFQRQDGDYIVAGYTQACGSDGPDFLVIRLNLEGEVEWAKAVGGTGPEHAYSATPTLNDGCVIVGYTDSPGTAGYGDFFIANLSSAGKLNWARFWGSAYRERAYSVSQTLDNGYIVTGFGGNGFLVIKLDSAGWVDWAKTFSGGTELFDTQSISLTSDGGYIVTGTTYRAGKDDFLVIKLDSVGTVEWAKAFGGTEDDQSKCVLQTSDNGYIVAGTTCSYGVGWGDFLVIKLDSLGTVEWTKTVGGTSYDKAFSMCQTLDNGYVVVGETNSYKPDIPKFYNFPNLFIVKLSLAGELQWAKSFGDSSWQKAYSVSQTQDGGCIVGGSISPYGSALMVVKFEADGSMNASCPIQDCSPDTSSPTVEVNSVTPETSSVSLLGGYFIPDTSSIEITVTDMCKQGVEEHKSAGAQSTRVQVKVYPNPFKEFTVIGYQLPDKLTTKNQQLTTLKIYDLTGRLVKSFLINAMGEHTGSPPLPITSITWNGKDDRGNRVNSGVYFCKLTTGEKSYLEKAILFK